MSNSFIFYRSYAESLKKISAKSRDKVVMAICDFVFDGTEPELDGIAGAVFDLIRPQLEESKNGGESNEG